ncbi:ABC transporter permease [Rhodococcus tibetensis]|uniref:ABC transporter permease n=1 Tax=Rhodococcus tibetensis TaxID=2965064 RepID=A0ABT1QDC6_9NOCA|nr:ABC transporter permease [Rhodococcus sp. FXJ9.536]MCQ4119157.1 ABC transporter permease [Rhodococcus sp. FXJ9.536]
MSVGPGGLGVDVIAVADHRAEIEAGLALGMTPRRAFDRQLRSAPRTAISSQVEQTAALGIVFLPGAMTGLILAGVDTPWRRCSLSSP